MSFRFGLYGKLNTGFYGVEVAVKVLYKISSKGATPVIYIPLPEMVRGNKLGL